MNAGRLNETLEIWKPTITRDEYGNQKTTFAFAFSTRCDHIYKSGNREIDNDEVVYIYSKTFVVRIYHNIDEFDHIKYNGKFYRILEIERDKDRQMMTIEAVLIDE